MTNDEFKWLIGKCLHGNHFIQVTVTDSRCAVNRIPSAFSKTLDEVIQTLVKNFSLFCDPHTQFVRVFNLQPAAMLPPNLTQKYNDFWCSLEMDICRRNDNGIVRTTAMHINFSNGHIFNEAGFLSLFEMESSDGTSPAILGRISPELIFVAWSELRRKVYTQELSSNDKNVAEAYNNPLCFHSNYQNLSALTRMYHLSTLRLGIIQTTSILSEAQPDQLAVRAAERTFTFYEPR